MIQSQPKNLHNKGDYYFVLDSFYVYAGDQEDRFVQKCCRDYGYWDADLTHWMIHNIKPGSVCVDIGANNGYFTELLSRLSGSEGTVISFEPNKILFEKFLIAQKMNSYEDCSPITMFNYGLSNKNENNELIIPLKNVGAANLIDKEFSGEDAIRQEVSLIRMDSIFKEKIDFIKIDIEGYEEFAWQGFPQTAIDCPLIVAELGPHQNKDFILWLEKMYTIEDLSGNVISPETILDSRKDIVNAVLKRKLLQ